MPIPYRTKDPDDKKDFSLKWYKWLVNDTIDESEWIVPDGIEKITDGFTGQITTIWLAGGTAGREYHLVNRIHTVAGRIEDQSMIVRVTER